ncbi:MAG TPA: hypothetical protein PLI68_05735 [Bacteroidia bacterium]|nr:hypothetical protein [Bacteroidia bacterium]
MEAQEKKHEPSEEVKKILDEIDFTKARRGEIIFLAVAVEDMCDRIILETFIKEDKKEAFALSLLANEVSIGFRVKTMVVGFILKNYPSKHVNDAEQTEVAKAFEKITSLRNHAAHRKMGYDENMKPYLWHIKTDSHTNKSKPVYLDGKEWTDFEHSVFIVMNYMIKYLRLPKN